jgi:hypothetical protein
MNLSPAQIKEAASWHASNKFSARDIAMMKCWPLRAIERAWPQIVGELKPTEMSRAAELYAAGIWAAGDLADITGIPYERIRTNLSKIRSEALDA